MKNTNKDNYESSIMDILSHEDLTKNEPRAPKKVISSSTTIPNKRDAPQKVSLKTEIIIRLIAGAVVLYLLYLFGSHISSLYH